MPIHDWTNVDSGLFHDFHQSWSIRIKDALNDGLLPDGLTALVEQKVSSKEADVLAVDSFVDAGQTSGGLLTKTRPKTTVIRSSLKDHYAGKANRIVVRHLLGRTVAVIEIVSPGNKDSKRAIREFVEKSQQYLISGVHLLLIDLFPPTSRDPDGLHALIWDDFESDSPNFQFPNGMNRLLASYESGDERTAFVEPIAVGQAMPDMPLFLVEGGYVNVPLERTYVETWAKEPAHIKRLVESEPIPSRNGHA